MVSRFMDDLKDVFSHWKERLIGTILTQLPMFFGGIAVGLISLIFIVIAGILKALAGGIAIASIVWLIGFIFIAGLAIFPIDYNMSYKLDNSLTVGQAFGALKSNLKNYRNIFWGAYFTVILKFLPFIGISLVITILSAVLATKIGIVALLFSLLNFVVGIAALVINVKYIMGLSLYVIIKLMNPDMKRKDAAEYSQQLMDGHRMDVFLGSLVTGLICGLLALVPVVGWICSPAILLSVHGSMMTNLYMEYSGQTINNSANSDEADDTEETVREERKSTRQIEDDVDDGSKDVFGNDLNRSFEQDMIKAIKGAFVTKLTHSGVTEIALPIDIVQKNGVKMYNFFVKKADGIKPVQIPESEIEGITVQTNRFDPKKYVTWTPHWNIDRDWMI